MRETTQSNITCDQNCILRQGNYFKSLIAKNVLLYLMLRLEHFWPVMYKVFWLVGKNLTGILFAFLLRCSTIGKLVYVIPVFGFVAFNDLFNSQIFLIFTPPLCAASMFQNQKNWSTLSYLHCKLATALRSLDKQFRFENTSSIDF